MSRAILDPSANTPPAASGGYADLQPLDNELASQLPPWDLVPPHSFVARKPRKPKPVALALPPVEPQPVVVESEPVVPAPVVEIADEPVAVIAEISEPDSSAEIEAALPVAEIEPEDEPLPAARAEICSQCEVPLEPGSAFCPECGHKQ